MARYDARTAAARRIGILPTILAALLVAEPEETEPEVLTDAARTQDRDFHVSLLSKKS